VHALLACVVAYLFSGHMGIYRAQRIGTGKHRPLPEDQRASELATGRRADGA
jgi:hypothetical protein